MIKRAAIYIRYATHEQMEPRPLQEPKGGTTERVSLTSQKTNYCDLWVTGSLTGTREKSLACSCGANAVVPIPRVRGGTHDYLHGVEISYAAPLSIPLQAKWPKPPCSNTAPAASS